MASRKAISLQSRIASSYPAKCSKLLNIFASAVSNYTHCVVGKDKPDYVAIKTPENSYEIYVLSVLFLWLPLVRNVSNFHFIDLGFEPLVCTLCCNFRSIQRRPGENPQRPQTLG